MLTPKNRQNLLNRPTKTKLALIMLVFTLLLINESIFAAEKNNNRSNNNQRRQQATRPAPVQRSTPNISRNTSGQQSRISTRSNVTRNTPSSQQLSSRNNISINSSPRISQQQRTTTVRQPASVVPNRRNVLPPAKQPNTLKSPNTNPGTVNTNANIQVNNNISSVNNNLVNNRNNLTSNNRNQTTQRQTLSEPVKQSFIDKILNRKTSRTAEVGQTAAKTNNRENLSASRWIGRSIGNTKEPSATQSQTLNTQNITNRNARLLARSIGNQKSSGDTKSNNSTARETKSVRQNETGLDNSKSIASAIRGRKTKEISTNDAENKQSTSARPRSAWSILRQSNNAKKQEKNNQNDRAAQRTTDRESKANNRTVNTNERERKGSARESLSRNPDNSRQSKNTLETRSSAAANRQARNTERTGTVRSQKTFRDRASQHIYDDRPNLIRHTNKNVYAYRDRSHRTHYRVVEPSHHYLLCYDWGWHHTYRYFYPYYHRKYLFVSLGGYWPYDYSCLRYYWYGYHPYYWYGYYPIAREVEGDTYNYYTYNYYGYDNTTQDQSGLPADYIPPVDHNTFADVREKLAQQQAEVPDEPTPADIYFENAVKAFEAGDLNTATAQFAEAIKLAPDDMILPFAYSQALLANEQYSEAANVLRQALSKVTPEKEGVFYPRGLYANDETLSEHIARLTEKAQLYSNNADLQLLLGYQLLGTGKTDEAFMPLWNASQDPANAKAATVLLELRETIINSEDTGDDIEVPEETENIEGAENTENTDIDIISTSDEIINKGSSIRLKETVFMATLLTLVSGSGIYHYIRC